MQDFRGSPGKLNSMDGGGKIGAGASQEECDTSFHGRSSDALFGNHCRSVKH
jgi:hypothetical protein